ncbi:MAG: hypothetical protein WBY44_06165, partial [Bryobacteraceae bacterium]
MDFYQKYELIDPLPGEGTKSFRARQIATGREVSVHLLTGGKTAENEALLARLRTLPAESLRKLLEVGDNEGVTYVVTEAPPYLHLGDWLGTQERAAGASDAAKFSRAGAWKIPAMGAPSMPPVQEPRVSGPGEFTMMFQQAAAKEKGDAGPMPQATPPPSAPSAGGPGEFTRMFQAAQGGEATIPAAPESAPHAPPTLPAEEPPAVSAATTMRMPSPAGKAEAVRPAASSTQAIPAAFSPALPLEPATPGGTFAMGSAISPSATPSNSSIPGEFTSMFNAPPSASLAESNTPVSQATQAYPAAPPRVSGPGEFTSMFNAPPSA